MIVGRRICLAEPMTAVQKKKTIMGIQSASRLDGDSYQHLYSWYEILQLLANPQKFDTAFVEHPDVPGAGDDVTLHPAPGSGAAARYYQIKFHVDHRESYGFKTFLVAKKKGTCLLEKLFVTWKSLRAAGPCEVWLISNWAADADFGVFIDQTYSLKEEFLKLEGRAKHASSKETWRTTLKTELDEFHDFAKSLRLRLGFANLLDLEEMCSVLMRAEGLKSDAAALASGVAIVRGWIAERGKSGAVTKQRLLSAVSEYNLKADVEDAPTVALGVHAWDKQDFDRALTVEIDWTAKFDRETRTIPHPDYWNSMRDEVKSIRTTLSQDAGAKYIDFRGKTPLSCGLLIGAAFPSVAGFSFRTEQATGGTVALWASKAEPSEASFEVRYEEGGEGDDALVFLSITGNGLADAKRFFKGGSVAFSKLVYAEPSIGTGQAALKSAADAVALARRGKELLQSIKQETGAYRLHLIVFCPLSYALFLGQQLNALGTIITYERTQGGGYQAAATLMTG